jgi:hypothetical protein
MHDTKKGTDVGQGPPLSQTQPYSIYSMAARYIHSQAPTIDRCFHIMDIPTRAVPWDGLFAGSRLICLPRRAKHEAVNLSEAPQTRADAWCPDAAFKKMLACSYKCADGAYDR